MAQSNRAETALSYRSIIEAATFAAIQNRESVMNRKIHVLKLEETRAVIGGAVTYMTTSVYQPTYVSLSAGAIFKR